MNRRIAPLVLLAAAAALFGLSWHNARATRAFDAQTEASNRRLAAARTNLERTIQPAAGDQRESARLEHPSPSVPSPAAAAPKVNRRMDWGQWLKDYQATQRDPKVQLQELAAERSKLHLKYAPLYRRLGWSAEKIEGFENAEARRSERQSDLMAAISSQGMSPTEALQDPGIAALHTGIQHDCDVDERAVVGEAEFAQSVEYRRTLTPREMVRSFAATAVVAGEPVTPAQAEQLVSIIASASPAYVKGHDATMLDVDWSRVDEKVTALLSPNQLELLQTVDLPPTGGRSWGALCRQYSAVVTAESGGHK